MFQKGVLATLTVGSRAAWYVDEMLAAASRWVSLATAKVLLSVDQYGIDRFVNGLPHGFRMVGQELRRGQAGRLQGYLMLFGLGVVAIFAYLFGISALLPWVSSP